MSQWEDRALAATVRRDRMMSFGPYAFGLLVDTRHGLFAVDPEDSSVTSHLLNEGVYAEHELALAASFLRPDSNVLIVGTHIGALAVPISRLCKHMDAVEANPATQRLVQTNFLINRCDNVVLHGVAASNNRDPIEFLMSRDNSGGSKRRPLQDRIHYVYDQPEIVKVDAWPLDDLLPGAVYDYILMDIEGSEYFALRGMQRILAASKVLCVEFLPHHLIDVAGVGIPEFWAPLEPHFDRLYIPSERRTVEKDEILSVLHSMFDRGEGHDGLCFMKAASPDWNPQPAA